jgi:hypothetical protein
MYLCFLCTCNLLFSAQNNSVVPTLFDVEQVIRLKMDNGLLMSQTLDYAAQTLVKATNVVLITHAEIRA